MFMLKSCCFTQRKSLLFSKPTELDLNFENSPNIPENAELGVTPTPFLFPGCPGVSTIVYLCSLMSFFRYQCIYLSIDNYVCSLMLVCGIFAHMSNKSKSVFSSQK